MEEGARALVVSKCSLDDSYVWSMLGTTGENNAHMPHNFAYHFRSPVLRNPTCDTEDNSEPPVGVTL